MGKQKKKEEEPFTLCIWFVPVVQPRKSE